MKKQGSDGHDCDGIDGNFGWCPKSASIAEMKSCDDHASGADYIKSNSGVMVVAWEHHNFQGLFQKLGMPKPTDVPSTYNDVWIWDRNANTVKHDTMNYEQNCDKPITVAV
jgi:hypothetical protein